MLKGQIYLLDLESVVVKKMPISHAPFNHDVLLDKCLELFNDPDPCVIHMTYSKNALGGELYEYIQSNEHLIGIDIAIDSLDKHLSDLLDLDVLENYSFIRFI